MSVFNLISFVIIAIFAVFAIVSVIIALVKGLYRMLVHIGCVSVAVILSILLAKLISPLVITNVITNALDTLDLSSIIMPEVFDKYPLTVEYLTGACGAVLAIVLFFVLLSILYLVAFIVSIFVGRLVPHKRDIPKLHQLTSVLVGIISAALYCTVIFAPLSYLTTIAADALSTIDPADELGIQEPINSYHSNPIISISRSKPHTLVMDFMFSYGVANSSNLKDDAAFFVDAVEIFMSFSQENADVDETDIEKVGNILDTVSRNPGFINIFTEIVSVGSKEIMSNGTFFGYPFDDVFDNLSDKHFGDLFYDYMHFLSSVTSEGMVEDIQTLKGVILAVGNSSAFSEFWDDEFALFENTEDVAAIITPVLESERSRSLLASLTAYSVSTIAEALEIDEASIKEVSYKIKNPDITARKNTPQEEARILAEAISSLVELSDKLGDSEESTELFRKENIEIFQNIISKLNASDTVSTDALSILAKGAMNMLNDSLPEMEFGGFTELVENAISGEGDTDIGQLLDCATAGVAVAESLTNGTKPQAEDVGILIENMNEDIADSLKNVYSDSYFTSIGVPEDKSSSCNRFVSEMLDNMAKVSDDKEEIEKETAAVSNLIEIAQLQTGAEKTDFLSTKESSDEFVESCLESAVFTNTLESFCVDDKGESVSDPLGFAGKLNETAQNNLIDSISDIKNNGSENEKKACDYLALIVLGYTVS